MVEIMRSDTANRTPENRGFRPTTPHNPALRIIDGTGEDAIVGSLVAFLLDRDELRFDIEAERLDRARKAVLGQSSTVLLKRSISVCFAICWRTLPRCPLARSRRPDWSAAPLVGRFSATR